MLVERISDPSVELQKVALETLKREIRESTSSMTSVPKPLKFLRPHYDTLKEKYEHITNKENKVGHISGCILMDVIHS